LGRAGGGSSIVGGAGGGSPRLGAGATRGGRLVDLTSRAYSDKEQPADTSEREYGEGRDSVCNDPDEIGREVTEAADVPCCVPKND